MPLPVGSDYKRNTILYLTDSGINLLAHPVETGKISPNFKLVDPSAQNANEEIHGRYFSPPT